MSSDTFDKVRAVIADVCAIDRDAIKPDGKLIGFGLDSVRLLDLILGVEEAFGLTIADSDPELIEVQTVGELVALIERRRAAR